MLLSGSKEAIPKTTICIKKKSCQMHFVVTPSTNNRIAIHNVAVKLRRKFTRFTTVNIKKLLQEKKIALKSKIFE